MVAAALGMHPLLLAGAQLMTGDSQVYASNLKFVKFNSSRQRKLKFTRVFSRKTYGSEILFSSELTQKRNESSLASFLKMNGRLSNSLVGCSSNSGKSDSEISDLNHNELKKVHPDSLGVESLLTAICDTTSIAEFKMDLAGFQLYVKRNLVEKNIPQLVSGYPLVPANTTNQILDTNGSVATTSLVVSETKSTISSNQRIVDTAPDEGLMILPSLHVGVFRRCRTIKGNKLPPSCKENQQVKEGQILCYIEQISGETPVLSNVSGEVVRIIKEDGDPVGYGDPLLAILPSFPGIMKLR
ncbi:biotin carboxyl carrier protein of acetyl-CoA carboxylase-like isoform X1 [Zingiber officinale]|uniref:biotin carboxyl carrier protein of acetyl-CoA carboxylase-like isoform X1 n=1 Tax=Zingiber officinale TaxID=94328 RepID=UPI001C4AA815|nr:biotin carboxyl carrier protein of acetyl-CoA carboxylase-like isoform X1 [Zingiber officinale]